MSRDHCEFENESASCDTMYVISEGRSEPREITKVASGPSFVHENLP